MSAAATAAGYLYASGRLSRLKQVREREELERMHGVTVAKALLERKPVKVTYKRRLP